MVPRGKRFGVCWPAWPPTKSCTRGVSATSLPSRSTALPNGFPLTSGTASHPRLGGLLRRGQHRRRICAAKREGIPPFSRYRPLFSHRVRLRLTVLSGGGHPADAGLVDVE